MAQSLLLETDLPLAAIAGEVGYHCEFAFSKAFKRTIGVAPSLFRRRAREHAGPPAVPLFRAAA